MKGSTLILLCAVALVHGDQNTPNCPNFIEANTICAANTNNDVLTAHRFCNMFYKCSNGKPYQYKCPANSLYDIVREKCNWPHLVDCGDRSISDNYNDSVDGGCEDDIHDKDSDNVGNGSDTCNCNPDEASRICSAADSDGVFIAHEECNRFYRCGLGKPVEFTCPPGTMYNPLQETCDWKNRVECGDRVIPDHDSNNNNSNNSGQCSCDPNEAPSLCARPHSDGKRVAHENCNQFYICAHGQPITLTCPPNTVYHPYKEECDWTDKVDCGDRVLPDPSDDDNSDNNDSNCSDQNDVDNDINSDPNKAPVICADIDTDNTLVAHENCNQFYICAHGHPIAFTCPSGTVYNPHKKACDWIDKVKCGDRVIQNPNGNDNSDNNDSSNSDQNNDNSNSECNCNPNEAPSICAAIHSYGKLIAHENCNQFYICDHNKPIELTCPLRTMYNPYKERCDWAHKVECGDRMLPGLNDGDGGYDNNDSDNSSQNNNSNANNSEDYDNCNKVSAICADVDSDGVFVAHKNCNQFYKCAHGNPVQFTCPEGTLYNPFKEECDWSSKVECGDRMTLDKSTNNTCAGDDYENDNNSWDNDNDGGCNCNPNEAPSICARPYSDGKFVAHENCNQFYICYHGNPIELTCPPNTVYNPYKELCDWADKVECGSRVIPDSNENNDSDAGSDDDNIVCNCNPNEAPKICANADSDGIFVAHENCNKFYICANGHPVEFLCPEKTLYQPYKEKCEWANKVACNDRIISEPNDNDDECSDESSDSSSNESSNNSNENEDGNDTFYEDPSQAPKICAEENSDSILVAHENCNQFYQCSGGVPVALSCGELLFNTFTKQCDWPANVDCGQRITPATDDEECTCNPRNAPRLCARENFEGKFVAHEDCNRFYVCANGVPQKRNCAPSLFYNIEREECDWLQNVDCGSRTISFFTSLNKHLSSRLENK